MENSPSTSSGQGALKGALWILVVSAGLFAFLIWLVYFNTGRADGFEGLDALPAVNATCNAASAVLVSYGLWSVRKRNLVSHRNAMVAAFVFSSLFLISYVIYHFFHGETQFRGQGWGRAIYFVILISHIVLSAVALPLILTTFYLSLTGRLALHRRVARWTFPVWLYISVTGVIIYFTLAAQ